MAHVYVVRWAEFEGKGDACHITEHHKPLWAATAGRAIAAVKRERAVAGSKALYVKVEGQP